jgi:uncharacterized cupredoxin-like copper-binding protein
MRLNLRAAVLLVPLALSACGARGPRTEYTVIMTDFTYNPNRIEVPAGEPITLKIANSGAVVHNFIILPAGATVGEALDEADLVNVYWTIELQPGESREATFTAPAAAGEYEVVCSTAGHYMAGMTGTLVVVGP